MASRLVFTGAVTLILATSTWAQTPATPTLPRPATPTIAGASEIDGHALIGQTVQSEADDKTLGTIASVIIDPNGKVEKVVIGIGGVLGIGKKDVAVAWSRLHIASNGGRVTMNADQDQLAAMPDYVWPKSGRGTVWTASDSDPAVAPATTSSGSAGTADPAGKGGAAATAPAGR
jgi:hypothetical protein